MFHHRWFHRAIGTIAGFFLFPCLAPLAVAQVCPTWTVTVRDFRAEHPDFESFEGSDPGIVLPDLGTDGKPVYAGATDNPTTTGADNFDQWFRTAPGVNESRSIPLVLSSDTVPGICGFASSAFFPIDNDLYGNEDRDHNYHFTVEVQGQLAYGGGEVLTFRSDDDLWVFLNRRLIVDLGGVHEEMGATVALDDVAAQVGLVPGNTYDLHVFFAQRRAGGSSLAFQTALALDPQDTTAPEIVCPTDLQVIAPTGDGVAVEFTVTATDDVTAEPVVEVEPPSGSVFPVGTTTVMATARDEAGNVSTCSFDVTVVLDDVPQVMLCPRGQGWWKNHRAAWPEGPLTIGGVAYDHDALHALLAAPVRGDASIILAHKLVTAKLNAAVGARDEALDALLAEADALVGDRVLPVTPTLSPSSDEGKAMVHLAGRLAAWHDAPHPDCVDELGDAGRARRSGSIELRSVRPNPFRASSRAEFALSAPGRVQLKVVDLRGRVVQVLLDREQPAGRYQATWDGRDAAGAEVPRGVYFYVLENAARGERVLGKVIRAR